MFSRLSLLCCALVLALSTGCILGKKTPRTKDNGNITSEVEDSLKKRWLERRAAELTAQGATPAAAQAQAAAEFAEKYAFTGATKK